MTSGARHDARNRIRGTRARASAPTGSSQSGQALAESIVVGLLLLVPLIWALGVAAELHRGALAATAAAREAGVEAARATNVIDAQRAAAIAVEEAFVAHGLGAHAARVSLDAPRLERGEPVAVEVSFPVSVVAAPILGRLSAPVVWIRARHVARVDPFASRETASPVSQTVE